MRMMTSRGVRFLLAIAASVGVAQPLMPPRYADPLPMPRDRASDAYVVYADLLPGSQIEWGDAPRRVWLIEEATRAEPLENSCSTGGMMNPHRVVQVPKEYQSSFAEVLADFDRTCHERYKLDASQFHSKPSVRLLDEEAQKRYADQVSRFRPPRNNIMQAPPTPEEFKGAAGLHSFTAVYFNNAHTLALTEIGMFCGSLCGNWSWVVLKSNNGRWVIMPWVTERTIS